MRYSFLFVDETDQKCVQCELTFQIHGKEIGLNIPCRFECMRVAVEQPTWCTPGAGAMSKLSEKMVG